MYLLNVYGFSKKKFFLVLQQVVNGKVNMWTQ